MVGPNGAGKVGHCSKSSPVWSWACGQIGERGQPAEVGSSFDPGLTGTENLEAGMAIAGLTRDLRRPRRSSTSRRATALPLKHDLDGMVARLACALVVQGRPDVRIVDEALAIGDACSFQRKIERVGVLSETERSSS